MKRMMMKFLIFKMMTGTMMAMTSKHWFLMWMGLETKTMSMIPMMSYLQTRRKVEASMKYFLIQALAAAIILKSALMKMWKKGSWLMKSPKKKLSKKMMLLALFLKLSMAPFHFWFPEIMSGVKLTKGLLMTTWQKMAPTMMMLNMKKIKKKMMALCSMTSVLVGAWGGLKQTQTRKMMAFSSIKHMGWIMLISMYNPKMSLMMLTIYIMMKTSMFLKFMEKKTTKIAKAKKKKTLKPWKASTSILAMLSLGGLPPLTGFMKKLLGLKTLMMKKAMLWTIPLMMGSLMSLFFYLRMSFNMKMLTFSQKSLLLMKTRKKKKITKAKAMSSSISIMGMIMTPMMIKLLK